MWKSKAYKFDNIERNRIPVSYVMHFSTKLLRGEVKINLSRRCYFRNCLNWLIKQASALFCDVSGPLVDCSKRLIQIKNVTKCHLGFKCFASRLMNFEARSDHHADLTPIPESHFVSNCKLLNHFEQQYHVIGIQQHAKDSYSGLLCAIRIKTIFN